MSVDVRRCKYGYITGYQSVHLINGDIAKVALMLSTDNLSTGRTARLKGGNVNVVHDGQRWVECNLCGVA